MSEQTEFTPEQMTELADLRELYNDHNPTGKSVPVPYVRNREWLLEKVESFGQDVSQFANPPVAAETATEAVPAATNEPVDAEADEAKAAAEKVAEVVPSPSAPKPAKKVKEPKPAKKVAKTATKEETLAEIDPRVMPVEEVDVRLPESKEFPRSVFKTKLYLIDQGKRFKCDVTGEVIGSGTCAGVIAQKNDEVCYMLVKLYEDVKTLKKFDLTKHGYIV